MTSRRGCNKAPRFLFINFSGDTLYYSYIDVKLHLILQLRKSNAYNTSHEIGPTCACSLAHPCIFPLIEVDAPFCASLHLLTDKSARCSQIHSLFNETTSFSKIITFILTVIIITVTIIHKVPHPSISLKIVQDALRTAIEQILLNE